MNYIRIITFLVFCAFSAGAFAADFYTIDSVKVSASGANAKQAKDSATAAGQREALSQLLEKITGSKPAPEQLAMDFDKLSEMVQGIEVNDEKITSTYYSAILNISFNRSFIDKLLKDKNINASSADASAISPSGSGTIVIAPVLLGDNSTFEGNNKWRMAVNSLASSNRGLNLTILPSLRNINKSKITSDINGLDASTKESLVKIGQSYNADKFILAVAEPEGNSGNIIVHMKNLNDAQDVVKEFTVVPENGEDVYTKAAQNIGAMLEGKASKNKVADNVGASKITVMVPINSLSQWQSIKAKLESSEFIKNINVTSLNVKYATIELGTNETAESLAAKMAQTGMVLEKNGSNIILNVR